MLEVGTKSPQFTLLNQDRKEVSLLDFKWKKVVLYFYSKIANIAYRSLNLLMHYGVLSCTFLSSYWDRVNVNLKVHKSYHMEM